MTAPTAAPPRRPTSALRAPSLTALRDAWRAPSTPPGSPFQRHASLLERALGRSPAPGNRAEILVDGPATHAAMFAAIAQARDHVNIESYIVENDGPGQALAELLLRKRAEGVRINLIFDGWGSWRTPTRYFAALKGAGVALLEFNPINPLRHPIAWSLHLRDHRKLLVVDGRVAFIGGVNISRVYSSSSGEKRDNALECWRDTHVRIEGPVVADLQQLFLDHWRARAHTPPQSANYFPPLGVAGPERIAVAACDAGRRRTPLYRGLLAAIDGAERSVYVTSAYFVPTRRLVRRLVAAARRGVDVRLALPGVSDVWAPLAAGRATYGRLLAAGVRIFERHDAMLHSKTVVIDGVWSTVGSSNMDWRSFLHNAEANVVIVDRDFGQRMEELFQCDVRASEEVTLDRWASRRWTSRLSEWMARKLEFLL
ncbi:MAG TPA: phospholipase D-like domain-containing protein [Burkholderiaceae bacterium]|nr:phospholipase D-like domain-containing protein [Burkholderiaceae bacterium]